VKAHLYSCCAQAILEGNLKEARSICLDVTVAESLVLIVPGVPVPAKKEGAVRLIMLQRDIATHRGLIRHVAKQIPCNCLDQQAKALKAAPKTGLCEYCHTEKLRKDQFQCSVCKFTYYCSEECQRADWKVHKISCTNTGEILDVGAVMTEIEQGLKRSSISPGMNGGQSVE
jgi:MYND finger